MSWARQKREFMCVCVWEGFAEKNRGCAWEESLVTTNRQATFFPSQKFAQEIRGDKRVVGCGVSDLQLVPLQFAFVHLVKPGFHLGKH
jgi:hypothetical protein